MSKLKVLSWGDYACSTGFATVNSNIMRELNKTGKYDIDVIGINYDGGPYDTERFPGRVWPAISALRQQGPYGDYFGRQVFLDAITSRDYDIIFVIQDSFIVESITEQYLQIARTKENKFASIYYYPFDCTPKPNWVMQGVAPWDFPVAYTEYAKNESRKVIGPLAERHDVIYHGTNTKDFFPIMDPSVLKQVRKNIFQDNSERFIITNVNRNQGRKDVARSFMVLRELRDRGYEEPFLYMHMQETDFGGSIIQQASSFGLEPGKDWSLPNPQQFSAHSGFPIQMLNEIYNASDCYLTTTLGEGWGLSITEAMSVGLPVVGPDNTSLKEILGDNRGWLVPSGDTPTHFIIKESDNDRLRPLMNVEKAADAIIEVMEGKHPERAENAYAWASDLTWQKVARQWMEVFDKAANKVKISKNFK